MSYTATMERIETEKSQALLETEAKPKHALHRKMARKVLIKATHG